MKLCPLVAGFLLSNARLQAQDSPRSVLQQLARLSEEGTAICISGNYAGWKRPGEKDFVDIADSRAALLEDYFGVGFIAFKSERAHGID